MINHAQKSVQLTVAWTLCRDSLWPTWFDWGSPFSAFWARFSPLAESRHPVRLPAPLFHTLPRQNLWHEELSLMMIRGSDKKVDLNPHAHLKADWYSAPQPAPVPWCSALLQWGRSVFWLSTPRPGVGWLVETGGGHGWPAAWWSCELDFKSSIHFINSFCWPRGAIPIDCISFKDIISKARIEKNPFSFSLSRLTGLTSYRLSNTRAGVSGSGICWGVRALAPCAPVPL